MKIRPVLIVAALALPAALLAFAAPQHKPAASKTAAKKTVKPEMAFCAVTNEEFPKAKASGTSVYKGKTYYFCCAGCKPSFDKAPAKFAARADAAQAARQKAAQKKS